MKNSFASGLIYYMPRGFNLFGRHTWETTVVAGKSFTEGICKLSSGRFNCRLRTALRMRARTAACCTVVRLTTFPARGGGGGGGFYVLIN